MIQISYEQVKELLHFEDLFEPVKQVFIAYNSPDLIGISVNLLHFPNQYYNLVALLIHFEVNYNN